MSNDYLKKGGVSSREFVLSTVHVSARLEPVRVFTPLGVPG